MNCLKCENFWRTDIDESKCDCCHCRECQEEGKEKTEWKHTFIARLTDGIALTTATAPFLANALWKTLCTNAMTSLWCGMREMITFAEASAEDVRLAPTPTNSQPMMSPAVTVATITNTIHQPRSNPWLFSVPQTGVPARIWICQVISAFFCENAADPNNRSYSRNSTGRGGTSRPEFPTGIPHMQIFCYF